MLCGSCSLLKVHCIHMPGVTYSRISTHMRNHHYLRHVFKTFTGCRLSQARGHACENKWRKPDGHDTGVMVYNPLIKDKVPLILHHEKSAQWYSCGPTVYDSTHIGHASAYVRLDVIRRILSSVFNIGTMLVMGVTDVDDKIIMKSQETGEDIDKITKLYEAEFFKDMASLNVAPPNVITRVRDHMAQIIDFVKVLEKNGMAYKVEDGSVYFDVKKYGKYGQFAVQKDDPIESQTKGKRNSQDFALWKSTKPGEPWWESPWGPGRPGWHVECSAMASGIFGANFDIHSGGEDLMFPHHENELAQSCAFHSNDQWANYWIHTGHLYVTGQSDKMSKSLKNVISIPEFLSEYSSNHFRMLCLLTNYKKRIEYSGERMQKAVSVTNAINSIIERCNVYVQGGIKCADIPEAELYEKLAHTRRAVEKAYADDFNTPQALANVMRLVKFTNQLLVDSGDSQTVTGSRSYAAVAAVGVYLKRMMAQLGANVGKMETDETEGQLRLHKAVDSTISARNAIRNFAKDKTHFITTAGDLGIPKDTASKLMQTLYRPLWAASDTIRDDMLHNVNVQINDGPSGSTWNLAETKTKQKEEQNPSDSKQSPTEAEKVS